MVRVRKCDTSQRKLDVLPQEGMEVKFKSPSKKDIQITKIFRGKLSHGSSLNCNARVNTRAYYAIYSNSSENQNPQLDLQVWQSVQSCTKPDPSRLNAISIEVPGLDTSAPVCRTSPRHKNIETEDKSEVIKRELVDIKTEPETDEINTKELKVEETNPDSELSLLPHRFPGPEIEVLKKEVPISDAVETPILGGAQPSSSIISPTPHKIQLCDREIERPLKVPQSPASALSCLKIEGVTPKKTVKAKRRLNPSQTVNQQTGPIPSVKAQRLTKKEIAQTNHKVTEYFPIRRSIRKTKRTVLEEQQMMIEAAIKSECEDGLEVRNFEGKGRGVVTTRQFFKGDFVIEYTGELISIAEAKVREQLYTKDQNTGCYMYYFKYKNNQHCIDATKETGRLGRLVNHSRYGNLTTKTVSINNKPHLVLIAKDLIQEGEEVLYDYGDRSKESLVNHPWLNL